MIILEHKSIQKMASSILSCVGAPAQHAEVVSKHLSEANLAGHDSHGFIRVPQYVKEIRDKTINPKSEPMVVSENVAVTQVDGNTTFGQVVAEYALEIAIDKARSYGLGLVNMFNLGHTGRIGSYPEKAAQQGMAAIMCTGVVGGHGPGFNVAPFGGTARRFGTNPIAMAFPSNSGSPVLLDFATSIAAEGKLRVYRSKGELLPDFWVLDRDGKPSRDPNDYYNGGALLPIGGIVGGHKGYALSFMVTMLGAIMGSSAMKDRNVETQISGSTLLVIDLGGMGNIGEITEKVGQVINHVKDTPLAEGSTEVLYPGEFEAKTRRERKKQGIPIPETTWNQICALLREFSLTERFPSVKKHIASP